MELPTILQAAKFLKVSVSTLRNMVRHHELPYFKVRRQIRFVKTDLEEWVRRQTEVASEIAEFEKAFHPLTKIAAL